MLKYCTIYECLRQMKCAQVRNIAKSINLRWMTTVSADKGAYLGDANLATAKPFETIPSMKIIPWIGTFWTYLPIIGHFDPKNINDTVIKKRQMLGDTFREKIGSVNIIFTFNPDDMQTLYRNEGPYPERLPLSSVRTYRESRKQWYSTVGMTLLEGKEWYDLRSKTQKHLMKPKAIQAFLNPMQDVARDFVNIVYSLRDANKEIPNFLGELYKWSLESIALVGLDTRLGCLDPNSPPDSDGMKMINSVQTQLDCIVLLEPLTGNIPFWKYFPTPTWKKYTAAADIFSEIAFKHINISLEKLKTATDEDQDLTLLQSLLMTKGLDLSGAMVTVADMLTAGIDTTSNTVGFFLYHIARNPSKQEILYQEIKNLLTQKEDRITPNIFNELKYLKACLKESQRLSPIVSVNMRIIDHDIVASGYRIPAGTLSIVVMQGIGSDEKYFANPKQFLPERWLDKKNKTHPFAFLPFGVGRRSCVGRRLAELEMICLITELIRNFKIEYHYEDIGMYSRLINAPDRPLRYSFIER